MFTESTTNELLRAILLALGGGAGNTYNKPNGDKLVSSGSASIPQGTAHRIQITAVGVDCSFTIQEGSFSIVVPVRTTYVLEATTVIASDIIINASSDPSAEVYIVWWEA